MQTEKLIMFLLISKNWSVFGPFFYSCWGICLSVCHTFYNFLNTVHQILIIYYRNGLLKGYLCFSILFFGSLIFLQVMSRFNKSGGTCFHGKLLLMKKNCFIFRRDSPYDAVVMHPKHKGKKLEDLPENRYCKTCI